MLLLTLAVFSVTLITCAMSTKLLKNQTSWFSFYGLPDRSRSGGYCDHEKTVLVVPQSREVRERLEVFADIRAAWTTAQSGAVVNANDHCWAELQDDALSHPDEDEWGLWVAEARTQRCGEVVANLGRLGRHIANEKRLRSAPVNIRINRFVVYEPFLALTSPSLSSESLNKKVYMDVLTVCTCPSLTSDCYLNTHWTQDVVMTVAEGELLGGVPLTAVATTGPLRGTNEDRSVQSPVHFDRSANGKRARRKSVNILPDGSSRFVFGTFGPPSQYLWPWTCHVREVLMSDSATEGDLLTDIGYPLIEHGCPISPTLGFEMLQPTQRGFAAFAVDAMALEAHSGDENERNSQIVGTSSVVSNLNSASAQPGRGLSPYQVQCEMVQSEQPLDVWSNCNRRALLVPGTPSGKVSQARPTASQRQLSSAAIHSLTRQPTIFTESQLGELFRSLPASSQSQWLAGLTEGGLSGAAAALVGPVVDKFADKFSSATSQGVDLAAASVPSPVASVGYALRSRYRPSGPVLESGGADLELKSGVSIGLSRDALKRNEELRIAKDKIFKSAAAIDAGDRAAAFKLKLGDEDQRYKKNGFFETETIVDLSEEAVRQTIGVNGYGVGVGRNNKKNAASFNLDTPLVSVDTVAGLIERRYGLSLRVKEFEIGLEHDFDEHLQEVYKSIDEYSKAHATLFKLKPGKGNVAIKVGSNVAHGRYKVDFGYKKQSYAILKDFHRRITEFETTFGDAWKLCLAADLPDRHNSGVHAKVGFGHLEKAYILAGGGFDHSGVPEINLKLSNKKAAVYLDLDEKHSGRKKFELGFKFGKTTFRWASNIAMQNLDIPLYFLSPFAANSKPRSSVKKAEYGEDTWTQYAPNF